jgi:anti-sigma factor RsiW
MVSMNCRRARNLLFDFFDGFSSEPLRAEVERHLAECAECEKFASEMTRSLALLRHTPVEPLDENFNWKVRLAIHREKSAELSRARTANAWVRRWNVRYAVSGGLAFGAVLLAGTVLLRSDREAGPVQSLAPVQVAREDAGASSGASARVEPPRTSTNMGSLALDAPHLVSLGSGRRAANETPLSGAIDPTEAEQKFDSLITTEALRMSAREREEFFQRRIERMERLRQHLQSQQSAPAQP